MFTLQDSDRWYNKLLRAYGFSHFCLLIIGYFDLFNSDLCYWYPQAFPRQTGVTGDFCSDFTATITVVFDWLSVTQIKKTGKKNEVE